MTRYRVYSVTSLRVELLTELTFEFVKLTLQVIPGHMFDEPELFSPDEWVFCTDVDADDLDAALQVSINFANTIATFVAFTHGVSASLVKPRMIFDISSQASSHTLRQWSRQLPPSARYRAFRAPALRRVWELYDKTPYDVAARIYQAIAFSRLAASGGLMRTKFLLLYSALEALNPRLQERFNLPKTEPHGKCENCGHRHEVPVSSGIRHALNSWSGAGEDVWRQVRECRRGMVHAFLPLDDLDRMAAATIPHLERAVAGAVITLLGGNVDELDDLWRPIIYTQDTEAYVEGLVTDREMPPGDLRDIPVVCTFELGDKVDVSSTAAGEEVKRGLRVEFVCNECNFAIKGIAIALEHDPLAEPPKLSIATDDD